MNIRRLLWLTHAIYVLKVVTSAMAQLNQVSQRNASASEELAATAQAMSERAEELRRITAFFKVAPTGSHAPEAPLWAVRPARARPPGPPPAAERVRTRGQGFSVAKAPRSSSAVVPAFK